MVAKISVGNSLYGALAYNGEKINEAKGRLLTTNCIYNDGTGTMDIHRAMEDFLALMPVRSKVEKPVVHISLNPHPDDILTDTELQDIAWEYLEKMGFGNQPYLVFKHEDIDRHHLHIVTVRVDENGRGIDTRNNFYRSKQITRELERKYGLHDAERKNRRLDTPLHKVDTSAGDVKKQVGNIVKAISGQYRFQTMGEYCALLSLYNMTVEEVHGNVRGREYHGLVYSATDDKGNKVGNPFKSSQFGKSVGYEAVLKKFTRSKQDIKDRKLADMTKRTILSDAEFNTSMLHTSTLRGRKLRMKTEYAGDMDHPVKREEYVYSESDNDEIGVNTVFMCMAANHIYNPNSIVLQQKIEEVHNKDAELIYRNEDNYSVNDLGRVNSVIRTDSKGDEIHEMYSYLDRVPAYPTEIIKTNKGNVISAMKIDYEQQSNAEDHYTPSKVWKGAVGVTPPNIEYRPDCIYSHYDTHGNPRQVVDKNGKTTCYFWGYNGRHIVAKIENSTYNILLGYGIGTTYSEALPADVEAQLRNDEEENFIVTTYTYKPLVGITSITDPSGHSVYYEYDDSGKLKVIRDDKGKVLKSYDYHIVTDNQ